MSGTKYFSCYRQFHNKSYLACLTLIFLLSTVSVVAKQTTGNVSSQVIYGKVISAKSQEPIAYVNIGIINKLKGTVSSFKGDFRLVIENELVNDSLTFSCIGYKTKSYRISELINTFREEIVIQLEEEVKELDEVVIHSSNLRSKRTGRKTGSGYLQATFYSTSEHIDDKIGTELGLKMKSPQYPAYIKDFNFNITQNTYDYLKFRVKIYALIDDLSDKLINSKEIILVVPESFEGWVNVDLTSFNLKVEDDFVISLQLLEQEYSNKAPIITIKGALSPFHTAYFKDASLGKWSTMGAGINFYATVQY